jgi:hypothetical protein
MWLANDKTTNPKKLDSATDKTVETREGHDRRGSVHLSYLVKLAFGFVHPAGWFRCHRTYILMLGIVRRQGRVKGLNPLG